MVHVVVVNDGGTSSTSPSDQYLPTEPRPAVTGVAPGSGTTGGGTALTITSTGFTGASAVLFSTIGTTNFTVVLVLPDHGDQPAACGRDRDDNIKNPVRYERGGRRGPVHLRGAREGDRALSQSSGPTAGGQTVTITGTGFTGAAEVLLSSTTPAASFTVNSDTSITAVTPRRAAGPVNVYVRDGAGNSGASTASRYTYLAPRPAVTELSTSIRDDRGRHHW